jgi:MFS family permease
MKDVTFTRSTQKTGVLSHFMSVFQKAPVLKLLLLRFCAMRCIMDLRMPFMGIYMADVKGADELIIGLRGTMSTLLIVLLSMPAGRLAEKIGRRRLAYFGRVFGWIATLIMILTPTAHPEYLIISGLMEGFRMVTFIGWMAFDQELIPLDARGRYSGVSMLANGIVGTIAPIVGGLIWNLNPDYIWWISLFGDVFIVLPLMIIIGYKVSKNETENL